MRQRLITEFFESNIARNACMLFLCDGCAVPVMDYDDAEENHIDLYQTTWLSQTPLGEPVEGHDEAATAIDLSDADSAEECTARMDGHQHHQ